MESKPQTQPNPNLTLEKMRLAWIERRKVGVSKETRMRLSLNKKEYWEKIHAFA